MDAESGEVRGVPALACSGNVLWSDVFDSVNAGGQCSMNRHVWQHGCEKTRLAAGIRKGTFGSTSSRLAEQGDVS